MKPGVNYCHEKKAANSVEGLFEKNRKDPLIIKLVALRVGLCTMLDEKKVTLDSAIDIFEDEKSGDCGTQQGRADELARTCFVDGGAIK